MRIFWIFFGAFIFLAIVIFGTMIRQLTYGGELLEFEYPSDNIAHAIDKEILLDSLRIPDYDTININGLEQFQILPVSSWIEKKTYWKSHTMDLDSLGFNPDTVIVIVTFKNFKDGKPWIQYNYNIDDFVNSQGHHVSVYIEEETTRLYFDIPVDEINDTIRFTSNDNQQIVLLRYRSSILRNQ